MKNKISMDDKIICIHTRTSSYRNEKSDSAREIHPSRILKKQLIFNGRDLK